MENIQLSLFGRTYPELFQVTTERILEPCLKKSQTPIFQCLQVANGQPQEWLEGGEVDTAWRVLDAQYWGVPQRRKRIYLIGDFGGQRAGEILFKSESVLGYTPKSKEQRAEAAGQSTNSLRTESSRGGEVVGINPSQPSNSCFTDISPTLLARMGTGGNQVPCIAYEKKEVVGIDNHNSIINENIMGTLTAACGGTTNSNLVGYVEKKSVIPLRDEVTRNKASNGLGVGKVGGPCPTLTTADIHSVFYEAYQHNGYRESDTSGTLTAGQNNTVRGDTPLIVTDKKAFEENQHGGYRETQINGTLRAAGGVLRRRVGNSDNREYQDKGEYP
mgnify:FL=1